MKYSSSLSLLRDRELNFNSKSHSSIGFTHKDITFLQKLSSTDIVHRGCINTVKWSSDGNKLITGSDDRTVKIWDTSKSFEDIKLIETLRKQNLYFISYIQVIFDMYDF
jgi:WD40 repeat protein